jgi:hypothetical protein
MSNCKGVSTPLATNERLSATAGTPLGLVDATQYRSVVGALQYLNSYQARSFFSCEQGMSVFAQSYYGTLGCCQENFEVFEIVNKIGTKDL